jgi:hypothetical protein
MEHVVSRTTSTEMNRSAIGFCGGMQVLFMFFDLYYAHMLANVVYDTRLIETVYWAVPLAFLAGLLLLVIRSFRSVDIAVKEYVTFSKFFWTSCIVVFLVLGLLTHKP